MIQIRVLFFASIRALIGQKEIDLELPEGASVSDLKQKISSLYPQADQAMQHMLTSVNRVFSDDDTILSDQAEVAFFNHIAGG